MKLNSAVFISVCIALSHPVFAQDYYSTQTPGGYTSSSSGYSSSQSSGYSSSQQTGGQIGYSVYSYERRPVVTQTNTFFVEKRFPKPHRYRGFKWVDYRGFLPSGSVIGGYEGGNMLYVCHAYFNGGLHPGKIVGRNCNISWGGREIAVYDYQVLVSHSNPIWISASNGFIPANGVVGGNENGRSLYICQASYKGSMQPGKIVGANCLIAWGGREIAIPYYKVLVG